MKILLGLTFAVLLCVTCVSAFGWDERTDLDDYINLDDGYFSWTVLDTIRYDSENVTMYLLNMTSQKWHDETLVDYPVWYHNMGIAVPDVIDYPGAAYIWIGEQNNDRDEPEVEGNFSIYNMGISMLADKTKCIGAYVLQIPNQPMRFPGNPDGGITKKLSEDRLIGYSWRLFLDSEPADPTLAFRMPMTKAAKRGLDTVQEFAQSYLSQDIDSFLPLGASKRGWTVWSLAAVDQRVKVAVPIVFSQLNMPVGMMNHYRALDGQWTFAYEPYYDVNLTAEFHSERTQELFAIEDMYQYRERLTMPKVLIVASGDEFFSPTDSHAWWAGMPDPKYILVVVNTEHILFPEYGAVFDTITGVFLTYLDNQALPSLTWTRTEFAGGSSITATANPPPEYWTAVRAETHPNDTRRDFRLVTGFPEQSFHDVFWFNTTFEDHGNGEYSVTMDNDEEEWVGFYMFGYWPGPRDTQIWLSTEVQVTPDTFPAPPCLQDPDCYGNLV